MPNATLTPEQRREYYDEFQDFERFAEHTLKIKDDAGNIIPFILNDAQKRFYRLWEETKQSGRKLWFIILKSRQLGFSTLIQGLIYQHNIYNQNQKCLTMGHKVEASNNLFDIYKRFYDNAIPEFQPALLKSNEKKISYANLGSENKIDTAAGDEIGRSDTLQVVHLTEMAFYPDPKTTLLGLMQGAKNAQIFVIESTANGFNEFRERWIDAEAGIGDFIPFFVGWHEFKPYQKPFASQEEKEAFAKTLGVDPIYNAYDGEEDHLIKEFNVTLEQLNWRRWAIFNLCNKNVEQFHQAYPSTSMESFLSSGRPVFDVKICINNLNNAMKRERRGYLEPVYDNSAKYLEIINSGDYDYEKLRKFIRGMNWVDSPKGDYRLHYKPIIAQSDKYRFCAGSDQSEGLEQGDYSVIKVLDRKQMQVVLTWHGKTDLDMLGIEQHKIQVFLNNDIYFCNEKNIGQATIITGVKLGVNNYYAQDFDKGFPEDTQHIGFRTNQVSKKHLIDDLKEAIRESLFEDSERGTWDEALTFVYDERGRMAAQNKIKDPGVRCYDDRIIAIALMWRCHLWLPSYRQEVVDNSPNWLRQLKDQKKKQKTRDHGYMVH